MTIISRLDNDFYNFTMGQVIWQHYRDAEVEYRFVNRTATVLLASCINLDVLRAEIAAARALQFTAAELKYLAGTGLFSADYLAYLQHAGLPEVQVQQQDGQLSLRYRGAWAEAVFWETPLLSLVNELYCQALIGPDHSALTNTLNEGRLRLDHTITTLRDHPAVRFIEFGSRRRFSRQWQAQVAATLAEQLPDQLVGTSNPWLAHQLDLPVSGTMAHQLFMVTAALQVSTGRPQPLAAAQNQVLDQWEQAYAHQQAGRLLTALPDTFGTDFFLHHFDAARAGRWHGLRQDSGDPFVRCQQLVDFYRRNGLDPHDHAVIPSDGLTAATMVELTRRFGADTQLTHGCGTFLTNNLGLRPLSIVIKPVRVNGHPTVKLSDNIAKAMGEPAAVQQYRHLSAYDTTYRQHCTY